MQKNGKLAKMSRHELIQLGNKVTLRTFNKETYVLKAGLVVKNVETQQMCRIEEIFYEIRTVRTIKGNVVAKRKNKSSDLYGNVRQAG